MVKVTLPTQPSRRDQLLHRGMRESLFIDETRGSVEDRGSARSHDVMLGPISPNVKCAQQHIIIPVLRSSQ